MLFKHFMRVTKKPDDQTIVTVDENGALKVTEHDTYENSAGSL
jgi:hypothetical protein